MTLALAAAALVALAAPAAQGAPAVVAGHARSARAQSQAQAQARQLQRWLTKKAESSKTMVGVSAFVVAGGGPPIVVAAGSATLPRAYDTTSKKVVTSPGGGTTPASGATAYMQASVSKTITWTALTMLLDQGKFKLDDNVEDALPFSVRNPKFKGTAVTYRHLYTHTSGMKDACELATCGQQAPVTYRFGGECPTDAPFTTPLATTLANHVAKASSWASKAPGSRFLYSNFASSLAAVLVEQHSGMEFTAFTKAHIFTPLGMSHTTWFRPADGTAAETYTSKRRTGTKTSYDTRAGGYCYADWPSGQLWSTAGDMARFSASMLAYGRIGATTTNGGGGSCLYSTATGRLAFKLAAPKIGEGDSALGWFSGAPYYTGGSGHDGSEEGVSADLFVKTQSTVAVGWVTNSELSEGEYRQLTAKLVAVAEAIGAATALPSLQGTCTPVLDTAKGAGSAPATPGPTTATAAATTNAAAATPPVGTGTGAGACTVLQKRGVAYNGPIVAKYNNAGGATPITDVAACAQKCAANTECTYFAVNKSPSKGCVLKSNRRGSPIKHAAFLGHGTCEHAVPASCATTGTGQGWSKFKKNNLGSYKNIKNAGGCAQKCADNAECKYWVVQNGLGCLLNSAGAGRLLTKKGFMFHGTC